jgi:hypothetical protein
LRTAAGDVAGQQSWRGDHQEMRITCVLGHVVQLNVAATTGYNQ